MIEAIALLALIWAIAATLFAARLAYKLGRAIHGFAAALVELTQANEREAVALRLNDRWEELYSDLVKRIQAGDSVLGSSPPAPARPPRDLVN